MIFIDQLKWKIFKNKNVINIICFIIWMNIEGNFGVNKLLNKNYKNDKKIV